MTRIWEETVASSTIATFCTCSLEEGQDYLEEVATFATDRCRLGFDPPPELLEQTIELSSSSR